MQRLRLGARASGPRRSRATSRICKTRRQMTNPIALRNRFAIVKGAWDEHLRGTPIPPLGEGSTEEKLERLELALVDAMRERATPENAEQVADAMWTIVHTRGDDDPVKLRVTQHHGELAQLGHRIL